MQGALPGKMAVAAMLLVLPGLLCSQAIEIAPKAVKLVQVEGGPLALAKVSIRFAGADPQNWTVTATPGDANDPWIQWSAPGATTPAVLTVGIVDWRGESKKPASAPSPIERSAGPRC